MIKEYGLGDQVEMKKSHPCGSKEWAIIRMGADIKIRCCGCGRMVMLSRRDFEKDAKKITLKAVAEDQTDSKGEINP